MKVCKLLFGIGIVTGFVFLSACTTNLSSDQYDTEEVAKAQKVYYGKIVKARAVKIKNQDSAGTGTLAGAAAGFFAGSKVGEDAGENAFFALAGALLGGIAGHEIGRGVGDQHALQYIVHLDNGKTLAIIQNCKPHLDIGQRVMVLRKGHNRDRIVAA